MLYQIDAMTLDYDCQHGLPKALVEEFIRFRPHWAKATQASRINLIRQTALFLIKMGVPSYYPDSCWKGDSTRDFHPYIYTHEEMVRLFAVADNPGKRLPERSRDFHSVIYRLLYSSGLRVSEALNLTMRDIDFVEGTIYIRNSKNHKDRKLPIDKGMLARMEGYASKYHKTYRPEIIFSDPLMAVPTPSTLSTDISGRCSLLVAFHTVAEKKVGQGSMMPGMPFVSIAWRKCCPKVFPMMLHFPYYVHIWGTLPCLQPQNICT